MSLLFNMLSRLVIAFLPRSKHLSWLQSPSAVTLEPKKIKSLTVSPSIYLEEMGPDAMILVFWMLSFKPTFSFSSLTFIKRLLSFSSLSAIRVVSSAFSSVASQVRLFATPWTAAYQAPPSMGFSRQEYWRGVPLPSRCWSHQFMVNRWGNSGNSDRLFLGLQNHCIWWLQPWKMLAPWKKSYKQPRQHIKKQRHYFVNKGLQS